MQPDPVATFDRHRLKTIFPSLPWDSPTVVRCTERIAAEGRYITSDDANPRCGSVSLVCAPAFSLSVSLQHAWPPAVPPSERALLDDALLEGIMNGLSSEEYPAWLCAVGTTNAEYVAGETTVSAVRIAASLAIQDALRRRGWKLVTHPPGAMPHGKEPA